MRKVSRIELMLALGMMLRNIDWSPPRAYHVVRKTRRTSQNALIPVSMGTWHSGSALALHPFVLA